MKLKLSLFFTLICIIEWLRSIITLKVDSKADSLLTNYFKNLLSK